ncbi:MAG: hypothetical protein ABI467_32170 [Kofleriaceae bacterium]
MIRILLIAAVLLPACGDDGGKAADAAIDAAPPVAFTGELIDWDSDHGAAFCGVYSAKLVQHDDATNTDSTAPNGRIMMMVPDAASVRIDVTPPAGASQCSTGGLYQLPGIILTGKTVLDSGKQASYRMVGMDRLTTWYAQFVPAGYDPTKAIVFVHVEGTPAAVASSAAHDSPIAADEATWTPNNVGHNVVFPNSAVGTSDVSLELPNGVGAQTVPTVAGTITYLTLVDPS